MNHVKSAEHGMPLAPTDFAERLTHTDLRTIESITLFDEAGETGGYRKFVDERGWIQCEVGSREGDFRNFQLKQSDGTWTDVIPSVGELPFVFREYLFHLSWLAQKRNHQRSGGHADDVLSAGKDIAAGMNFEPFLTEDLVQKGKAYAESMNVPGHIAVCDGSRNAELYLDEHTFTPSYARVRLRDDSFSPPFVFSQLPPEWRTHALEFFSRLSSANAAQSLVLPERQRELQTDDLKQSIARQNAAARYRIFMVVGTSGIGKDTVIDKSLEWADKHGIGLNMRKTQSRVTDRSRRTGESPTDNVYVTKEEFTRMAEGKELIHPYQSRFDDRYGYHPDILSQELQSGNVTMTIGNCYHYEGVYNDIRDRLHAMGLLPPVLVLIDKDIAQTHVSIDRRDADSRQKHERIRTAREYQAGFHHDLASSERGGPVLHTVINNYVMFKDSIQRFLSIVHDHAV